jgi:hypothetical protein
MSGVADCPCLARGPKPPDRIHEHDIGVDPCGGRFAAVTLIRCSICRRLWLRYQWELEAETASGCWYETAISETDAAEMTAEAASDFILKAPWRIRGGSFFGHDGERIDRPATRAADGAPRFVRLYARYPVVVRLVDGTPPTFWHRKLLRWCKFAGRLPAGAHEMSQGEVWEWQRHDMLGLDFGRLF